MSITANCYPPRSPKKPKQIARRNRSLWHSRTSPCNHGGAATSNRLPHRWGPC